MSVNNDDIFKEAAKAAVTKQLELLNVVNDDSDNLPIEIDDKAKYKDALKVIETGKDWDDLIVDMSNKHAARFNRILEQVSDKEFTRLYLKFLEYAKPKKIRDTNDFEDQDMTINLHFHGDKKLEELNTIDIEHKEIKDD